MTPERYQQIGELYHSALELGPQERPGFLAEACAGDEELLREVESLIASNEQAGEFIHAPALEVAAEYSGAHQWYGSLLMSRGRTEEAIVETKRAQQLDPLSLIVDMGLGGLYIYVRRFDEAIAYLEKVRELHPEAFQPDSNLAYIYEIKGMKDEAVASYLRSRTLAGDTAERVAALKTAYARRVGRVICRNEWMR